MGSRGDIRRTPAKKSHLDIGSPMKMGFLFGENQIGIPNEKY